jgi:hypothetical protein
MIGAVYIMPACRMTARKNRSLEMAVNLEKANVKKQNEKD